MAGLPSEPAMCKDCAQHADFLIEEVGAGDIPCTVCFILPL